MPFWESQASLTFFQWVARAAVMFLWLLLIARLMGQRSIGQLHIFDFLVAVVIAGTTAGALNSSTNALIGVLATTVTLALLHILISYLALKNARFRRIVQDEPLVIVQNGQLMEDTLRQARFNLDDLLLELRQKNIPNLHDVEFAILESGGKISVIPKSQARPLQPRDLRIPTKYEGMPVMLIEDGNIIDDNLVRNGLDNAWLINQLQNYGIDDPKNVLVALLDTNGRLFVGKKGQKFIYPNPQ